jgi:hypothetical protein
LEGFVAEFNLHTLKMRIIENSLEALLARPILDTPAVIPQLPTGCVQLGYVRIAAAAGTAYTANTTALNAANITSTFVNALVPEQNWLEPARMGNM